MRTPYQTCPLCFSPSFAFLRSADCSRHSLYDPRLPPILTWVACNDCGHVFTDSYFSPAGAKILFSRAHAYQQPGPFYEPQRLIAARTIERVTGFRAPGGRWLDVGFGDGALLMTAEEFGFDPVGIDIRAAKLDGVETHACAFEDFKDQRRFAIVSLMDVLEHTPFPRQMLDHARQLIASGGILVVSTPNSDAPIFRQLTISGINPYWGELEHFHNFSRARLYALLAESGFAPYRYAVSERYRAGMEILARPTDVAI